MNERASVEDGGAPGARETEQLVDLGVVMNGTLSRRDFVRIASTGVGLLFVGRVGGRAFATPVAAQVPGGTLDPLTLPKFVTPLLVPPAMPRAGKISMPGGKRIDRYDIAVRQFPQQILPAGHPATTVWGYGPRVAQDGPIIFNAPSLTIESKWQRPVRITWANELVDADGDHLQHLLPVDPTLHWANPPGGLVARDSRPTFAETPQRYTGPVPVVVHLHGAAGVGDESDGYAEAWYLPDANDVPAGFATTGTWYDFFAGKAFAARGTTWGPGFATFEYPNDDRARANWYHDHTLGMTRLNVYAGPAGFFIVRGGPSDEVVDSRTGRPAVLPGPAPAIGDPPGLTYYEVPIAIQDRSFNADGSLFYPDTRAFFDGIEGPYIPETDVSPIWNPEFFGNMIIVNGATWPVHAVEQRRYRYRVLNGCNSRFLILDFSDIPGVDVWQIGNEGGFLDAPVHVSGDHGHRLLLGPAERADLIIDFASVPPGEHVMRNVGPDEPFGGGVPGVDFEPADEGTTGQVMAFAVVPARRRDRSTPPQFLQLPAIPPSPPATRIRRLALIEELSAYFEDAPAEARLGTVDDTGTWTALGWADNVSENPAVDATELWELYNTTEDAHPMHIHEVIFEVVDRQPIVVDEEAASVHVAPGSSARPPEPWETGFKDTVIAYPGEVTRVKVTFDTPGQFVWHCHIVEHEDNEMMRPYRVGPAQPGQPMRHGDHA
jgi:spore coat protein A, manganese oxidase